MTEQQDLFNQPDSQAAKILAWMQAGNRISPLFALQAFGCFRLAPRIEELRKDGHNIITEMVKRNDKRFAEYRLEK